MAQNEDRYDLPALAVVINVPVFGYKRGQEVVLTFPAVPTNLDGNLGFAMKALGFDVRRTRDINTAPVVCRGQVRVELDTYAPAMITSSGIQFESRQPLWTSDDY